MQTFKRWGLPAGSGSGPSTRSGSRRMTALAAGLIAFAASATAAAQCATSLIAQGSAGPGSGLVLAMDGTRAVTGRTTGNEAHALHFDGTNWLVDATLVGSDTVASDDFGHAVAISGTRILVGDHAHDSPAVDAGAAYIFEFDGQQWVQRAELVANDAAASDFFGDAVALSGNVAMVGAPGCDGLFGGSGAVYVFRYIGGSWAQVDKLLPMDPVPNGTFGTAIALRGDRAVIGQFAAHDFTGAADVFESLAGDWSSLAHLTAFDGAPDDEFGRAVAIDGNHIVVAASHPGGAGAVYFFDRGSAGWTYSAKFVPNGTYIASVAACGERALVGTPGLAPNETGAAYLYTCAAGAWSEASVMQTGGFMAWFGYQVAISGAQSMIGSASGVSLHWFDATCGPWTSNGGARNSVLGKLPVLSGSGPLTASSAMSVELADAAPHALVALLIGIGTPAAIPFAGSVLQVDPVGWPMFLTTDATGGILLNGVTPAGVAGVRLTCQCIVVDPTADYGFALSNALLAEFQ